MRRKRYLLLMSALLLLLAACGNRDKEGAVMGSNESVENTSQNIEGSLENNEEKKILIAYFSWADNVGQGNVDAVTSASVTVPGNVEQLAEWIAVDTEGELFSIQTAVPYPADWDECLERANQEKAEDFRPELVQNVEDMEEYDVVFLGYPNWWYSCPMAILSFIEANDFSGKEVYLFCSHGTGGIAGSVKDITANMPDGNISENVFDVYEEDTADSREAVNEWITEIFN